MNIRYYREAYELFEVAKDLAHDTQNLAQEMICYEWMGRVQRELGYHDKAKVAFKKVLQLAWITRLTEYEYLAYYEIATQFFYMHNMAKSNEYEQKAQSADFEPLNSPKRLITEDIYWKKVKSEPKQSKYERLGCKVYTTSGKIKKIDATQDYALVMQAIYEIEFQKPKPINPLAKDNIMTPKMIELRSRRVGNRIYRTGTPLERMSRDVQSPHYNREGSKKILSDSKNTKSLNEIGD